MLLCCCQLQGYKQEDYSFAVLLILVLVASAVAQVMITLDEGKRRGRVRVRVRTDMLTGPAKAGCDRIDGRWCRAGQGRAGR